MELAAKPAKPGSITDRMADFFGAYAADLPVAYKARPPLEPGRFTYWVEGGAIWTGGDPVSQPYYLTDFTNPFGFFLIGPPTDTALAAASPIGGSSRGSIPGIFDLNPKIGWEAATGFDYKFAGSPWHVSGQFRYGQGGKTSGTASSAASLDPSIFFGPGSDSIFGGKCPVGACLFGGSETVSASYKERHWLADLALGYDLAGAGRTAMQVKGGLRISEFVSQATTSDKFSLFFNFPPTTNFPGVPGTVSSITINSLTTQDIRNSFLGAGPVIGLEGSLPFAGAWSFDYKGDLAVLFGTQKSVFTEINTVAFTPPILNLIGGGGGSINTETSARFATMLSGDIQAGVSYWFSPNLKLGLSYRIDTLIAVKNSKSTYAGNLLIPDRYWHGPRLTLTGAF